MFPILFALLLALNVADVYTTVVCVSSGKGYEANPVSRAFIDSFGLVPGLIISKAIAMFVVYLLLRDVADTIAAIALLAPCIFYAALVTHNIQIAKS